MDDLDSGPESPLIKTLLQADSQELAEFIAQGMAEEDRKDFDLSPSIEGVVMSYENDLLNQAFAQHHSPNQVMLQNAHQQQTQQQYPLFQNQHHQQQQQQQQQQQHQPIEHFDFVDPPHWNTIPDLLTIPDNEYDFQVELPPENPSLRFVNQKLFIKLSSTVAFNASYIPNALNPNEQMYLRAMILFSDIKDMHLAVNRCANHRKGDGDIKNVLKSVNPKALYYGTENGQFFKERLSIVIPIDSSRRDESGRTVENLGFQFECQSSCSSGINRRATAIVFTLENQMFSIVGKKVQKFKVCSCPKRDAQREEAEKRVKQENGGKRKNAANKDFPHGKRPMPSFLAQNIKTEPEEPESPDETEPAHTDFVTTTVLPNLSVATALVPDILKYIYDVHAGKMARDKSVPVKPYKKMLNTFQKMQKQFEHPKNEE